MAETNSTSIPYPRSNITLELWIPYVLIGASCVTFLAVHFWCYHKRNRIKYLRKQDEFRVKLGLIERRRITSVIMSRYQAEIEVATNTNSSLPALHIPWDTDIQVRPPMAYSQDVSLEDNVEVMMEESMVAWGTASNSSRTRASFDRNAAQVHNNSDLLTGNKTGSSRYKEKSIQTNDLFVMEVKKLSEDTKGLRGSQSIKGFEDQTVFHKPEVIGIFNIPQRYAWDRDRDSLSSENIPGEISKRKYFGYQTEGSQTPYDLVDGNVHPMSGREVQHFRDLYESKQIDSNNPNFRSPWMQKDSNSGPHNVQHYSGTRDQITDMEEDTNGSLHEGISEAFKKSPKAQDHKTDTSASSTSSPVSSSTVFVYHGHPPPDPQITIDRHRHGQLNGTDSTEDLESVHNERSSPQLLSSFVSIDGVVDSSISDQEGKLGNSNDPQPHKSLSFGADSNSYVRKQLGQTDQGDEYAGATDSSTKSSNRDRKGVVLRTLSQQTENQKSARGNSLHTQKMKDKVSNPDTKESRLIVDSKTKPPSYDHGAAHVSLPGPSRDTDQSEQSERRKILITDTEVSKSVTV